MTAAHTLYPLSETQTDKPALSETSIPRELEIRPVGSIFIDSEEFPCPDLSEWISSDMASKLPMKGQAEAHRNAIRKAERRKASNVRVAEKVEAIDGKKAERMRGCCSVYVIREYPDGRLRHGTQTAYCSNRFCASCAHRRSMRLIGRYSPILREFLKGRWMYHLVLTYKNESKPIERKRISEDIRNFKRREFWKEYGLAGGLYSVEATVNRQSNTFHTHIHLLIFTEKKPIPCIRYGKAENIGRFDVEQVSKELSAEWLSVTGNSSIVYGGKVKGGVYEVLKYITKFQFTDDDKADGIETMPDVMFRSLYEWTVGSRFVSAFGGLYGKVSRAQEMSDEEGEIESELGVDYGDEPYVEYIYEFKNKLDRMVIIAERNYVPSVSRNTYSMVRRE